VSELYLVVAFVDPGAEFDFLDLHLGLLLLCDLRFLLLFEKVLAEIHDAADRGFRVGRNLDEIQPLLGGHLDGIPGGENAYLLSFGVNDTYLRHTNFIVAPRAFFGSDTQSSKSERPRLAISAASFR